MGWWERTLFGVVSADLTLRFSAELLGLVELVLPFVVEALGPGRTVSISAGAVLGSRLLLGLDIAGWTFGWLLLFQSTPLFFPRQGTRDDRDSDWTAGLTIGIVATLAFGGTLSRRMYAFVSLPFPPRVRQRDRSRAVYFPVALPLRLAG